MQNSRGTYEGLRKLEPDTRPFVMTRATYAGGQRYASTWTGDNASPWNHLRQTTPQLLNLGLSGFAMSGADVGGFAGSPQPELLTRWLQVAAFQPIDRDHTASGTAPQEPWENGSQKDVDLRRSYIEERYRLIPYLYSTAEEMSRTGLPIVRPLFLEFPAVAADDLPLDLSPGNNAFLLGPDLLIAPSPSPDELDTYTITLPPSGWYDYWTGARVISKAEKQAVENAAVSDQSLLIHTSPETLPVFVRAGAIIPEQPLVQSTEEKPVGPLTLRVYPPTEPGQACSGGLYLDDGVSYAYQKGVLLREAFICTQTAQGLTVRVFPQQGSFAPWWSQLSIEVYGQSKSIVSAHIGNTAVRTSFDADHHRVTAVVPDDGKGLALELAY
jgi:alpha-glucosidase